MKNSRIISWKEIQELLHNNAEKGFNHTTYQEESQRFHYLMNGDFRAIEESMRTINPTLQGRLSLDPVRNIRYLFVINTGIATRYLIESGVPQETVYSISDIYIRKADLAQTVEEIMELNREVWTVFVETVNAHKKESMYSKPILFCLNYIETHFVEKITLECVAGKLHMNHCYLATLFKKETGITFAGYVLNMRIRTAICLLTKTDYTYTQIAYSLAFCSQSHFTKTFHKYTGYTPKQYRMNFYNSNLSSIVPLER